MNVLGLRTTIYRVADIEKAKAWYHDVLGFGPYFDQPFYVGFNVAGYELGLVPDESTRETKSEGVNTYWGVNNVTDTFDRLLSLGATEFEAPTEVGDSIVTAMVKDPWGNLFGILYNPHFSLPPQ